MAALGDYDLQVRVLAAGHLFRLRARPPRVAWSAALAQESTRVGRGWTGAAMSAERFHP